MSEAVEIESLAVISQRLSAEPRIPREPATDDDNLKARIRQALAEMASTRRQFTRTHWVAWLAVGTILSAIVPAAVFAHYVWQLGMTVALFPLALFCVGIIGALTFAFIVARDFESRRFLHLVPISCAVAGILIGVGFVQMSAGIHVLSKATGVVQWTGESLTQVGKVVTQAKGISGDAKAISENIGELVTDAKTAVSDARSTIAEVGKLADEGAKSTRSIKAMLEELKAFYELVRQWLGLSATTPNESPKDGPQQRDAKAADPVAPPQDGYFKRAWAWLHSLWSKTPQGQK